MKIPDTLYSMIIERSGERMNRALDVEKKELFSKLSGVVVEIGPGAGANLQYYPRSIAYAGVEPVEALARRCEQEASRCRFVSSNILRTSVENLKSYLRPHDLQEGYADFVVCTFVLCSVQSRMDVLLSAIGALRPGGQFLFIEHVVAPRGNLPWFGQKAIKPLCRFCGRCDPTRDSESSIRLAGFKKVESRKVALRRFPLAPIIIGTAVK